MNQLVDTRMEFNTPVVKVVNIPNWIPTVPELTLGQLALNVADAKLYCIYTDGISNTPMGVSEIGSLSGGSISDITGGTLTNGILVLNRQNSSSISIPLTDFADITATSLKTNSVGSYTGSTRIYLYGNQIVINASISPQTDRTIDLGSHINRFRSINTLSGSSTYWTSTNIVTDTINARIMNLGIDSQGYNRQINADTSIIKDDTLSGGYF